MREDILNALEAEYAQIRAENEKTENARRTRIRTEFPQIEKLMRERETLIYGTIRQMLNGNSRAENLPEKTDQLNRSIRESLEDNGLPADYLAPVCRCRICNDTGYFGDPVKQPCECLIRAYRQKVREEIGVRSGKDETFGTFNLNMIPDVPITGGGITQRQLSKRVRDYCKDWAEHFPQVSCRDMLITGQSGLGKTFLMHAMADVLIERGVDVLMVSAYKLLQAARKEYFQEDNSLSEIMKTTVLMIDDLGSEPLMNNVTIEMVFHILNERQNRLMATIISTNLSLNEFKERYTERVASRLCNSAVSKVVSLAGTDLRKVEGNNG